MKDLPMAEQKESSVLFSLKELMSLEENRIKEEEAEKERRVRQEAEARAAAERAARDAEERRIREEEERRRQEEQRQREETARLDAIRQAEIEKARADAEHRARLEAMAAQQSHEAQLAALRSDSTKKRLKLIVLGVSAVLVLGAVGAGFAWNNAQKAQQARDALLAAESQQLAAELGRLKTQADEAAKKEEDLHKRLNAATDEATRNKLEADLARAKTEKEAAQGRAATVGRAHSTGGGSKPAGGGAKPCSCPPGDPLCPCM